MTLSVSGTTVVNQNRSFVLGTATPGSPATGMIRYNSSLARFEVYNGSAWVAIISSSPATSPAWAWGFNNNGQLGDYSITSRRSPISVIGGFTDWIEISAGTNTTFAIRANGTLWGWGRNDLGQLGIGNNTSRRSPVSVLGGFTDWVKVSASSNHIAAIRSNGTAWCWGRNDLGQLGTNNTISRNSPVSVVGGFTDWQQINTGGAFHTVAIRTNGTAWGWGYGGRGQLGTNSTTTTSSPVSVVGGFTDWVQISAGRYFTVAIRANGTAWGWGFNSVGALGDGTSTGRSSPVSVVGGFTDWVQISAGGGHTAALRAV